MIRIRDGVSHIGAWRPGLHIGVWQDEIRWRGWMVSVMSKQAALSGEPEGAVTLSRNAEYLTLRDTKEHIALSGEPDVEPGLDGTVDHKIMTAEVINQ